MVSRRVQGLICEQYVKLKEETNNVDLIVSSIAVAFELRIEDVRKYVDLYLDNSNPVNMNFALEEPIFSDYSISDYAKIIKDGDSYRERVKRVRDMGEDDKGVFFLLHGTGKRKYRPQDLKLVRLGEFSIINHYE